MDEPADQDLMARVARGDEAAFRLISRRHTGRVVGIARRITGNDAVAEEIAQEALLRVWINAARWQPAAEFRTWLYRIVVNLCLNERRRVAFAPLEAAGDPPDPHPDPAAAMERRELARLIDGAIDALPPRQRTAIVLSYREGLSNAETAAALDTSVSGVETLLVRAKRSLRVTLGPLMKADLEEDR